MKILRLNRQYIHPIFFTLLSMPYFVSFNSILNGKSLFYNIQTSLNLIIWSSPILIMLSLLLMVQFKLLKISKQVSIGVYFIVFGTMIISTFQVNNKLLILLSFIYLFFSFYFYTTWELFLSSAALNPKFHESDIEKETIFKIKGRLINKSSGEIKSVYLTNLDDKTGYIYFTEKIDTFLVDSFDLELEYEGVAFNSNCTPIVSQYNGVGFNYNPDKHGRTMRGLYNICLDRQIF